MLLRFTAAPLLRTNKRCVASAGCCGATAARCCGATCAAVLRYNNAYATPLHRNCKHFLFVPFSNTLRCAAAVLPALHLRGAAPTLHRVATRPLLHVSKIPAQQYPSYGPLPTDINSTLPHQPIISIAFLSSSPPDRNYTHPPTHYAPVTPPR